MDSEQQAVGGVAAGGSILDTLTSLSITIDVVLQLTISNNVDSGVCAGVLEVLLGTRQSGRLTNVQMIKYKRRLGRVPTR